MLNLGTTRDGGRGKDAVIELAEGGGGNIGTVFVGNLDVGQLVAGVEGFGVLEIANVVVNLRSAVLSADLEGDGIDSCSLSN